MINYLVKKEATPQNKTVKPVLYFHPSWGEVAQEQKYIYQFLHKELPRLQENQISLSGIEIEKREGSYAVVAFIRSEHFEANFFRRSNVITIK